VAPIDETKRLGIFDAADGKLVQTLKVPERMHSEPDADYALVVAVAFDQENGVLAIEVDYSGETLHVLHWEPASQTVSGPMRSMPMTDVYAPISLSRDGSTLSLGSESEVVVYSTRDLSVICTTDRITAYPSPGALSSDGSLVAYSDSVDSPDGPWFGTRILETRTGKTRQVLMGCVHDSDQIAFSLDDSTLVADWRTWDVQTGKGAWYNDSPEFVDWLQFSHDGHELATSCGYGVSFWNPEVGLLKRRLRGRIGVGYSPGDDRFASLTPRRRIAICNRRDGTEQLFEGFDTANFGYEEPVAEEKDRAAHLIMEHFADPVRALTTDGAYVLAELVPWSQTLGFDVAAGETFDLGRLEDRWFPSLKAFSPGGEYFLYEADAPNEPRARSIFVLRDIEHDDSSREIARPEGLFENCIFLPDGKRLVVIMKSEDDSHHFSVINVSGRIVGTTRIPHSIDGDDRHLTLPPLSVSPDGSLVATANESTIFLFDTRTLQFVRSISGHRTGVKALAFSPDGKRLASADRSCILIWDLAE
jgi:WD40 repeat protein